MGVSKYKDEEYIEGIRLYLKKNPDITINEIPKATKEKVNDRLIPIGQKLADLRRGEKLLGPSSMKIIVEKLGFEQKLKIYKPTEEEYMKAFEGYLKLNTDKTINTIPSRAVFKLDEGKEISIGSKLQDIKRNKSLLSEKNMKILFEKYGLVQEINVDHNSEDLIDALELYFKKKPNNKIDDIKTKANITVEINGIKVNLSSRLSKIRNGEELKPKYMKILKEKYNFRTAKEIEEEEKNKLTNNIDIWLEKNPGKTINDMLDTDTVEIDNVAINIGETVNNVKRSERRNHNNKYIKLLKEEYGLKSDVKIYIPKPEEYIEALDIWLKENSGKTVNDMKEPASPVVISNGHKIELARKICRMRIGQAFFPDEYMTILEEKYGFKMKENRKSHGFVREIEPLKKIEEPVVKEKSYEKYLDEFDGDIELAKEKDTRVKEIGRLIRERRKNKKTEYTLDELKKEFDVDLEELDKYLSQIKSDSEKSETLYIDENETLRNYCIRKRYNYDVIFNLIKKSRDYNVSFRRIIQEYLENGQKLPTRYVYEKNEILVKHILLGINVDSSSVIEDMKHSYTVDEAITRDVFKRNVLDKKYKWLELPYTFLIEELGPFSDKKSEHNIKFKDFESLLSKEEQEKLLEIYDKCSKTLRKYQYLEIGFEKDHKKVKELIKKYSLTEEEIQKSMFVTLEYENGIKRTKNEVKSERLRMIQPIILNWSKLNEQSKNKLIKAYSLTQEEIQMIESYDKEIKNRIEMYDELLKEHNITKEKIDTLKHYHNNNFYNVNLYK